MESVTSVVTSYTGDRPKKNKMVKSTAGAASMFTPPKLIILAYILRMAGVYPAYKKHGFHTGHVQDWRDPRNQSTRNCCTRAYIKYAIISLT